VSKIWKGNSCRKAWGTRL